MPATAAVHVFAFPYSYTKGVMQRVDQHTKEAKNKLKQAMGIRMRKYRNEKKLSLDEVGKELGVSASFLGLVERGKRGLSPHNLYLFTRLFNITVEELWADIIDTAPVRTDDTALLKKINFYTKTLSLEQQDRLLKIIKLVFPKQEIM